MKIGVGAIFRDEYDYVVEWIAWHRLAGFNYFYIADNGSTDGTLQLLEALECRGYLRLIHQPVQPKNAQIKAYERILQASVGDVDAMYFIDADEFISHDSFRDGEELRATQALLMERRVGGLALTWRLFGSSGKLDAEDSPVVERFTRHATYESSRLIKSAVKISYVQAMSVHYARLHDSVIYVDASGEPVRDFITYVDGAKVSARVSGLRDSACSTGLMINHYVVKSKQEFLEKKVKRGDAMLGIDYERSMDFFSEHDRNDVDYDIPPRKLVRLKKLIYEITSEISLLTAFGRKLRGYIDVSNHEKVVGWLVDDVGKSSGLEVTIFINGESVGSVAVGYYRADLLEQEISDDGMNGFTWCHHNTLTSGSIVEVRVKANRFSFPNGRVLLQ
jgi:glycosyltransferase involved in cell wall biosynthesis